ncbi:histidine containing phosphotransmitter protein [Trichodelitschia bisporula]|uniref:Histidine containing phosphotransmitter protein n=1 Tax=Trichodelitschia bisporula TaxID=703511 RepID=A0A6G1I9E2_9PEZI|nr:histidine containing phosphotransmitter protein [Trichodelitschia bisporula]
MEDDDENPVAFSKSIVADYFDQADLTFKQMDEYLEKQDLKNISKLGHFLKGSSATLGLTKLKDSCEKLQHYGDRLDEAGHNRVSDSQVSLRNCKKTIEQARREFKEVEDILQPFYQDD